MIVTKNPSLHPLFIAMTFFIILGLAACTGTKGPAKVTLDNGQAALQLKGKVIKLSRVTKTLTIKPPNGDKTTFMLLDSTIYEGTESMQTIERGVGVLVTYTTDENGNQALIVRQLPDGSCG
jgi:hypothetical protein